MPASTSLLSVDWANTKAAYRFLGNDRVHDTSAFPYEREPPDLIGYASSR
ncbi:transposase DNA-binding-containing protein [Paraburkholderia sp. GAS448]